MLIQISIENIQPLTGSASSCGNEPLKFVGWLELFRAVADLVKAKERSAEHGDLLCERVTTHTLGERNPS